jgi:hypothetical protein
LVSLALAGSFALPLAGVLLGAGAAFLVAMVLFFVHS